MALGGPTLPRIPAIGVVLLYGIVYLALTTALGVPEARGFASQVARRARF
jgi:hypothetical protein